MIRQRAAGLTLVLALAVGAGGIACSDDGEGDGAGSTTTTTTTSGADGGATTTGEDAVTTLPDETTTTAAPSVAGPEDLQSLLVDPARIGDGFALDASLGDGTFSGELCEDVTLDRTWDDQASQALTRGDGDDRQLVTQAVLAFADEATASAFVQALVEGTRTCLAEGEVDDVDAGDEATIIEIVSGGTTTSLAIVRAGAQVSVFDALRPTAVDRYLTQDLLVAAGAKLAG